MTIGTPPSVRADGRRPDELRPITLTLGVQKWAEGSCRIRVGDTEVLCAATIEDRVPPHLRGKGTGWVTAEYSMLPGSSPERVQRKVSGRSQEIQRLIGRSLRSVCDMAVLGERVITVDCDVLQADGGTRTASITGAYIALHDALSQWMAAGKIASIPLTEQVAATSVGMVDGALLLDLEYSEDSIAEVDMIVVMDGRGRFIEVQGTGEQTPFDRARLDGLLDLAIRGIDELVAIQRKVIEEDLDVYES